MTRIPEGAPVRGWLRLQRKFPTLRAVRRPPLGTLAVGVTVVLTAAVLYAVTIEPKIHGDYYRNSQKEKRPLLHADREQLANGLRPWSDPFERK